MNKRQLLIDCFSRKWENNIPEKVMDLWLINLDNILPNIDPQLLHVLELRYQDNPIDPETGKRINTYTQIGKQLIKHTTGEFGVSGTRAMQRLQKALRLIKSPQFQRALNKPTDNQMETWKKELYSYCISGDGWLESFEDCIITPELPNKYNLVLLNNDQFHNTFDQDKTLLHFSNCESKVYNYSLWLNSNFFVGVIGDKICFIAILLNRTSSLNIAFYGFYNQELGEQFKDTIVRLFDKEDYEKYYIKFN